LASASASAFAFCNVVKAFCRYRWQCQKLCHSPIFQLTNRPTSNSTHSLSFPSAWLFLDFSWRRFNQAKCESTTEAAKSLCFIHIFNMPSVAEKCWEFGIVSASVSGKSSQLSGAFLAFSHFDSSSSVLQFKVLQKSKKK